MMKSAVGTCFICKHPVAADINIFKIRTSITKTILSQKLSRIVETPIVPARNVSQDICNNCFSLLNQLDDCECRLMALEMEVKLKFRLPFTVEVQNRLPEEPLTGVPGQQPCPGRSQNGTSSQGDSTQASAGGGRDGTPSGLWTGQQEIVLELDDDCDSDVSIPDSDFGADLLSDGDPESDAEPAAESEKELNSESPTGLEMVPVDSEPEPGTEPEPDADPEPDPDPTWEHSGSTGGGQRRAVLGNQRRATQSPYNRTASPPPKTSCKRAPDALPRTSKRASLKKSVLFWCDICDEMFYSNSSLAEHSKTCHPDSHLDVSVTEVTAEPATKERPRKKRGRKRAPVPALVGPVATKLPKPEGPLSREEEIAWKAKQQQLQKEAEEAAMEDVRAGYSVREAAARHGIKRTTLQDRKTGRYQPGVKRGRRRSVSEEAEARIACWVLTRGSTDTRISSGHLRSAIRSYLITVGETNSFKDNMPGERWLRSFVARYPEVARQLKRKGVSSKRTKKGHSWTGS